MLGVQKINPQKILGELKDKSTENTQEFQPKPRPGY